MDDRTSSQADPMSDNHLEHDWVVNERMGWTFCRRCTIVQRADGQNKPCRGPVGLSLRGAEVFKP